MKSTDTQSNQNLVLELRPWALPLPMLHHLLLLGCLSPYALLYYHFADTWLGEGFLWIPVIMTYVWCKHKIGVARYGHHPKIEIYDGQIKLPGALFNQARSKVVGLTDIVSITYHKMSGRYQEKNIEERTPFRIDIETHKHEKLSIPTWSFESEVLTNYLHQYAITHQYTEHHTCIRYHVILITVLAALIITCAVILYPVFMQILSH